MDGLKKSILLWRDYRSIPGSQYKTMTVQFNITQTPGYGTYLDDAVGMTYGKGVSAVNQWQEFFGYRPCLFKDGAVVGYLNPNDYTKFEDGTDADISSGDAGDVMVEFPRRGIKINKTGTTVTVSMTDNPENPEFTYYAHTNIDTPKDYFYVGAYLAVTIKSGNSTLYSVSGGHRIVSNRKMSDVWMSNYMNGTGRWANGYCEVGFYHHVFIQCMYLLQFKGNLDSQSMVGLGFIDSQNDSYTGATDNKGLIYGTSSGKDHMKLFGIEDYWGNVNWHLGGFAITYYDNGRVKTSTGNFNCYGTGYTPYSTPTTISTGVIKDAACTPELGFIPISTGSYSGDYGTYFCDMGGLYKPDSYDNYAHAPLVGANNAYTMNNMAKCAGIFEFQLQNMGRSLWSGGYRIGYL